MTAAYVRPDTVDEAVAVLAEHGDAAHILAGGTALTLLRRQGLIDGGVTVDLGALSELAGITGSPGGELAIGAMTTLRAIETSPEVRSVAPSLAAVAARVATVRIRNQATLGGNLAHADPAQDPPPILIALDAEVEIANRAGVRREPLDGFFVDVFETILDPADVLVRVHVPAPPRGSRIGYEKFLPRTADDYATVAVAARIDADADGRVVDARIVLGGVAAVPLRVHEAEGLLRGADVRDLPAPAAAEAVRDAVDPVDDARGSAGYKRAMAAVWTDRLLRRLASEGVTA